MSRINYGSFAVALYPGTRLAGLLEADIGKYCPSAAREVAEIPECVVGSLGVGPVGQVRDPEPN